MTDESVANAQIKMDRRRFGLGLAFLSAAGMAAWRLPRVTVDYLGNRKLDDVIPKKIGDWSFQTASGLVIPPEDQLSLAIYSQMLTRVYADGVRAPVMLLLAQSASQTGVLQIHRPEACYTAGGYTLSPVGQQDIALTNRSLRANTLSAANDRVSEHIVFWTRVGRHMPLSWAEQRWSVAKDNLEGIIPDALLARISVVHEDRDEAMAIIGQFIRSLLGSLPAESRRVLVADGAR